MVGPTSTMINGYAHTVLRDAIAHAAHFLPTQGPISVFVHHNTLHAFEELPFEQAVVQGLKVFNAEPYLSEDRYHDELATGRILRDDIEQVLLGDLGDCFDHMISIFGTRYSLRLSMLLNRVHHTAGAALAWTISEAKVLKQFHVAASEDYRRRAISSIRKCTALPPGSLTTPLIQSVIEQTGEPINPGFTDDNWTQLYLHLLWKVCTENVSVAQIGDMPTTGPIRPRDRILDSTGQDTDLLVNEQLIKFSSAFIDQGFATYALPDLEQGYARSFAHLNTQRFVLYPNWMKALSNRLTAILQPDWNPLDSIASSLQELQVPIDQHEEFIRQTLLALSGWSGMLWQLESNVPWAPRTLPKGTLEEFLAIRLILDICAAHYLAPGWLVSRNTSPAVTANSTSLDKIYKREELAFTLFQLAQIRGWDATELISLEPAHWKELISEVDAFNSLERRRILQIAYERHYREAALTAFSVHARKRHRSAAQLTPRRPCYQISTCIDDREESFRRHLEEVEPECETHSAAGFYAVAMYYKGGRDAFFRPLCPVNVVPQHYVLEEPLFSAETDSQKMRSRRQMLGRFSQNVHTGSRSMLGGSITAIFGSIASIPMIARILLPRVTAKLRSMASVLFVQSATELHLERETDPPGKDNLHLGYSVAEMSKIVTRILQDLGLTKNFAPIVLFLGHGSSSLNNPHESAYNCGACSGGRGGPNARAFATMANDPRVRELVQQDGIAIPDDVHFIGGYHNTCNDTVEYFDLDNLPRSHREMFRKMEADINEARSRNALERSRRFHSIPTDSTPAEALAAVERRSEDLSQARPEYNHATNAMCYVGRRQWTRGLFMDRRSFLVSYDPTQDNAEAAILARILAAAIPVCGGISLEYYFSTVDNEAYGCGSKLPHNITSLVGVMTGAASDLRPGLSAQMIEIHEPLRILFLIETTPEQMLGIINSNPIIKQLVVNRWVQVATFQIETGSFQIFADNHFAPWYPTNNQLDEVKSSHEWFCKKRDHLGFATIVEQESSIPSAAHAS